MKPFYGPPPSLMYYLTLYSQGTHIDVCIWSANPHFSSPWGNFVDLNPSPVVMLASRSNWRRIVDCREMGKPNGDRRERERWHGCVDSYTCKSLIRSSDTKGVIGYCLQPSWSGRGHRRYIWAGKYPHSSFKNGTSVPRGICSAAIEVVKWFRKRQANHLPSEYLKRLSHPNDTDLYMPSVGSILPPSQVRSGRYPNLNSPGCNKLSFQLDRSLYEWELLLRFIYTN